MCRMTGRSRGKWWVLIGACVWLMVSSSGWLVAAEADARYANGKENSVGQWLRRLSLSRLPGEFERGHASVTGAFRSVAAPAAAWTVRVLSDDQQTALGVVVRSDGLILTKASELSGKILCLFSDGVRLPARKVADNTACDLALLRVDRQQLAVARWSEDTAVSP